MTIDKAQFSELKAVAERVLREYGFEPEFSAEAQQQTAAIGAAPGSAPGVRDLRNLLWCSIDNDDSRDLDQLSVAEKLSDGAVKVLIAIADVDSLVPKDSPVDEHASTNTTSIYTAAGIYPMLPEKLSTDLTSLLQGKERLAMVAELVVGADGGIAQSEIYRALVLNRAKLAYGSVAAWLDGKAPPPPALHAVHGLEEQLRIQDSVAQLLRRKRHERGALSLETRGTRATFDGSMLSDLRVEEKNRAQELIEDLMIAANSATARFLKSRRFPSLRRVLKAPARWDRIVAIARESGGTLPPEPDAVALDDFLREQRQARPDEFPDLSLSIVKLLGSGEYMLELPDDAESGHFGLAVRDYTHSTAPNRRFPDLLTQRLLKAAIAGGTSPYSPDELSDLAAHCSEQEKDASKIERQINKSAAALLLAPRVGEQFSGIVTGASEKGTWVRVEHPYAEGKIVRGFEGLDVGDRVRVRLDHVDSDRAFIDFSRIR